nr:hypothetical protein [Candidatus Electrothrix aestuarii]
MKKIIGHFVVLVLLSSAVVFLHSAIEHSADNSGIAFKTSVRGRHNSF